MWKDWMVQCKSRSGYVRHPKFTKFSGKRFVHWYSRLRNIFWVDWKGKFLTKLDRHGRHGDEDESITVDNSMDVTECEMKGE